MPSAKILENQKKTAVRLEKQAELERHQAELDKLDQIRQAQLATTKILIKFLNGRTSKTEITNQLKEIGTPDAAKVVTAIGELSEKVEANALDISPLTTLLEKVVLELEKKPNDLPEAPESVKVDFSSTNTKLDETISAIKGLAGQLTVKAPDVNVKVPKAQVVVEKLDISTLVQPLVDAVTAIRAYEAPEFIPTDLTTVEQHLEKANELLTKIEKKKFGGGGGGGGGGGMVPYKDPITGLSVQVATEADGSIPVTVVAGGGGGGETKYVTIIDDTTTTNVTYIGKAVPTGASISTATAAWQITRIDESASPTTIQYADGDILFNNTFTSLAAKTYN